MHAMLNPFFFFEKITKIWDNSHGEPQKLAKHSTSFFFLNLSKYKHRKIVFAKDLPY